MPIRSAFGDACRNASRDLRRLPSEARKVAGREVQQLVADPLAEEVRSSYASGSGQARALSGSVKTRVGADPSVSVGGGRPIVSGGASGRQLVYGVEFGSGTRHQRAERLVRNAARGRSSRGGSRTRRSTAQFAGNGEHHIFGTFAKNAERTYERWLDVLDKVLEAWEASRG